MIRAELSLRTLRVLGKSVSETFLVPVKELPRVFYHSLILAFIIAGFWLLDSLKDPILTNLIGIEYQPTAKFFSVISTLFVVCAYDFATSVVSKPTLFHLVSGVFGLAVMILAALLADPSTGFENKDKGPHRMIGWAAYFTVEAYGSLMVALFWSFTNSIMDLEQAKGAYGLIISVAQVGAIVGATIATQASVIGIPQLFLISAVCIFSVSLLIKVYHIIFKDHATQAARGKIKTASQEDLTRLAEQNGGASLYIESDEGSPVPSSSPSTAAVGGTKKPVPGSLAGVAMQMVGSFYEGLILITQHRYTMKLLGISTLFEVVLTVLDYEFKVMGADSIEVKSTPELIAAGGHSAEDQFANLLGHFGQLTNFMSLLVSLLGFSFLVHKFNVKFTLLIFPTILFFAVIFSNLVPTLNVLFILVSLLKALTFSLSEPVKELLYIPTSERIKFKAKAWIDVFGCRLAKAAGSFVTSLGGGSVRQLRMIAEVPCIVISVAIIALAWSIGTEFQHLVDNNIVVGSKEKFPVYHLDGLKVGAEGLPTRKGLRPGDVGYDGYTLGLFEGVFEEDETAPDDNKI